MAIIDEVEGLTTHSFSLKYNAENGRWQLTIVGTLIDLVGPDPDRLVIAAMAALARRDSHEEQFPLLTQSCTD